MGPEMGPDVGPEMGVEIGVEMGPDVGPEMGRKWAWKWAGNGPEMGRKWAWKWAGNGPEMGLEMGPEVKQEQNIKRQAGFCCRKPTFVVIVVPLRNMPRILKASPTTYVCICSSQT
jgi:hypothetical protein